MKIENGTIKVVWISRNGKRIFSKMFKTISEAKKFGKKKKDFLIFKLINHKKMQEFEWKLLPYGNGEAYLTLIKFFRKKKVF